MIALRSVVVLFSVDVVVVGVCVTLCVKPVLEVEGEREEKEEKKNSKKRNKKEYLNKMGKKIEFWDVKCIVK